MIPVKDLYDPHQMIQISRNLPETHDDDHLESPEGFTDNAFPIIPQQRSPPWINASPFLLSPSSFF